MTDARETLFQFLPRNGDALFPYLEWLVVDEAKWSDTAAAHRDRGEWEACERASDVADRIRFYRLHREVFLLSRDSEAGA